MAESSRLNYQIQMTLFLRAAKNAKLDLEVSHILDFKKGSRPTTWSQKTHLDTQNMSGIPFLSQSVLKCLIC